MKKYAGDFKNKKKGSYRLTTFKDLKFYIKMDNMSKTYLFTSERSWVYMDSVTLRWQLKFYDPEW